MRNNLRYPHHPVYRAEAKRWRASRAKARQRPSARAAHRVAARLRPGMRFWSRPPNPARRLCALVRRILKFHQSEPMLSATDNRSLITDH